MRTKLDTDKMQLVKINRINCLRYIQLAKKLILILFFQLVKFTMKIKDRYLASEFND